jgi:hypothetical protein
MLAFDRNYMQMTTDFEKQAVISALLLHFRKKKKKKKMKKVLGSSFNQPKNPKGPAS